MHFAFIVLFQAAVGAAEPADRAIVTAPAPSPEPKLVCKMEPVTGSRIRKERVCRREGEKPTDFDDTSLGRSLRRSSDIPDPAPQMSN